VTQKNPEVEDPKGKDLYQMGVVAHIVRTLAVPDGRMKVLLQGLVRARAKKYEGKKFLSCKIEPLPSTPAKRVSAENQAIINRIRENLQVLVEYEHLPEEMLIITEEIQDPGTLSDVILAHYKVEIPYAQAALEELDPVKRLRLTDKTISDDLNKFILAEKIKDKARDEMTKGQREYYLREQIKQIQPELGETDIGSEDLQAVRERLIALKLPKQAHDEAFKQLKRLERMSPESSEFHFIEYSGPSNSALRRRPGPTKLQLVVASPLAMPPSGVSNSMVTLAKSSDGFLR
jgi:ATP-dependent Lon protease